MTPNEVLEKLETIGVKTSRSTLLRFEQDGLIPKPKRGSGGRAQGRFSDYPEETPYFFFAAWILVKSKKHSKRDIIYGIMQSKIATSVAKRNPEDKYANFVWRFFEADNSIPELLLSIGETIQYLEEHQRIDDKKTQAIGLSWVDCILFAKEKFIDLAVGYIDYISENYHLHNKVKTLKKENEMLTKLLKKHGINPA